MFAVGIGLWFMDTECNLSALHLINFDPLFPESVFKDLEVVLERFGSLVRINLGRDDADIIRECG